MQKEIKQEGSYESAWRIAGKVSIYLRAAVDHELLMLSAAPQRKLKIRIP